MPDSIDSSPVRRGPGRTASAAVDVIFTAALLFFVAAAILPASPLLPGELGVPVGILTALWAVVLLLAVVRWLIALRASGLARVSSGFGILPFSVVAVGAAAFLIAIVSIPGIEVSRASLLIGASCAVVFLLSWSASAWRTGSAARTVLVVAYLALSVLLPVTFQRSDRWIGFLDTSETFAAPVTADKQGKGSDVAFERVRVGDDWRNAAAVSAGGFFFEELTVAGDELLKFSVARSEDAAGSLVITLVAGDVKREAWRADVASLDAGSWKDVSVPVALSGKLRVAFEFDATGPGRVFVANNRMESSVRSVAPAAGTALGSGRNVILVVQDALRADRLGVYGSSMSLSPEIDRLAAAAVVFEKCIAGAPWTRPSVASIFTSLYPSVHGVETFDGVLSPSFDTLAEVFQRSGYRTAAVQGNATLEAERGFAQGFDEYRLFHLLTPTDIDPGVNPRADVVSATALDWLSQRGASPFFLYIHYMDTHSPYCPPKEFAAGAESPEDFYNGAVRFFSAEFAKLFEALKSAGLLDTTTIILTADHGEQFEEHGDTEHGNSVYVEEVQVPLIVWSPGRKTGSRSPDVISLIDVPVTLAEVAGLDVPEGMQGVSFAPALTGDRLPERDVYSELLTYKVAGHRYIGLTTSRWRYVHDVMRPADQAGRALAGQVFDAVNDPREKISISDRNPQIAQELMARVASFMASEAALGARLLPNRVKTPLSQEEIEKLTALGYISPSSETK